MLNTIFTIVGIIVAGYALGWLVFLMLMLFSSMKSLGEDRVGTSFGSAQHAH